MKPLLRLPGDATLRTLLPSLKSPEEFVRRAFGNMTGYHRQCQLRIALDTSAARPDYLVEMLFDDVIDGEELEVPQSVAVFQGQNHMGRLTEPSDFDRPWSSEAMRYDAVQTLIGELRGLLPKPSA